MICIPVSLKHLGSDSKTAVCVRTEGKVELLGFFPLGGQGEVWIFLSTMVVWKGKKGYLT